MTARGNEGAVSLEKSSATSTKPGRPKQVLWVVAALLASGVFELLASLSLYGLHSFMLHQATIANAKLKGSDHRTKAQLLQAVHQQPSAAVILSLISSVVLAFVARALWRGRYWSRWAVIGVWILSTFEGGTFNGASGVLIVGESAPVVLKISVALSSLAFLVALALVGFVRPIPAWLNLSRPDRRTAATGQGRRGLLSPRDPAGASRQSASTASPAGSGKVVETSGTEDLSRGDANTERARAKQRANTETTPRGATEARARARGSKSRRSGS